MPSNTAINDAGQVAATVFVQGLGFRGLVLNPATGASTLLNPLPGNPDSWALGINNKGDVLGYSFIFGSTENIGVWDPSGNFHTYFTEGTAAFPTISNNLLFNNRNQIVITETSDGTSYLVYPQGVRTDLASLTVNLPSGYHLSEVTGINDNGTIIGIGFGSDGSESGFILTPIPEPSSLTLFGCGVVSLLGWRWRRGYRV